MFDELTRDGEFQFQPDNAPEATESTGEVEKQRGFREWSDDAKERMRQRMLEKWKDPEYRQRVAEGRARAKQQKAATNETEETVENSEEV